MIFLKINLILRILDFVCELLDLCELNVIGFIIKFF